MGSKCLGLPISLTYLTSVAASLAGCGSASGGDSPLRYLQAPAIESISPEHVVILDIDGLRRDVLYDLLARDPASIPNLASLVLGDGFAGSMTFTGEFTGPDDEDNTGTANFGSSFQAVGVDTTVGAIPSYTFACQATLFTGEPPGVHGITGNELFDRFGEGDSELMRRGFSGGTVLDVNDISRSYEWKLAGTQTRGAVPAVDLCEALCSIGLVDISNSPNEKGYGGLASITLTARTVYEWAADAGLDSMVAFNMYSARDNYHNVPQITWVRPSDQDLCDYLCADPSLGLYDTSMTNRLISQLDDYELSHGALPPLVTAYFAGHDHYMHEVANDQVFYLTTYVDPLVGRIKDRFAQSGVHDRTVYVIATDHGHNTVLRDVEHAIEVDDDLEYAIDDGFFGFFDTFDFNDWLLGGFQIIDNFTVYVAQNSGPAHVHVKRRGGNWTDFPLTSDLKEISRRLYHYHSSGGGDVIPLLVVRPSNEGQSWTTPYLAWDPATNRLVDLQTYVDQHPEFNLLLAVERFEELNHVRSGDILALPMIDADYYIDEEVFSTHGYPDAEESVIPLIFAGVPLQGVPSSRRTIRFARQADIAPTVARLLGFPMPATGAVVLP